MTAADIRTAAEIVVDGRVQGVGYRNFVERKASQLGLMGYVMNLKDGRVRVRVEGGRMVMPVGEADTQRLQVIEKVRGAMRATDDSGCVFVKLIGKYAWQT